MKRAILTSVLGLAACTNYLPAPIHPPEATYSDLFPYYIESCAVSEFTKKAELGADVSSGGPGGHSLMYLNGVCRDTSAGYPVIKMCDNVQNGVGISVNNHFANANWVATQGPDFFFHGSVAPGAGVTRDSYDATEEAAQQSDIYNGVRFHDTVYQSMPASMSREGFAYDISIGTDYGTDLARNRFCARVPVSKAQMEQTVQYLNNLNAPYRSGEKEFNWSVFRNNCSQMIHDTLANIGFWKFWPQNDLKLLAAFDFPVPKNEFVNLITHSYDLDLADPAAIYADKTLRENFLRYDFLPKEPGVLADFTPVITPNEIYGTDERLIFFDEFITGDYQPNFIKIYSEPNYTNLKANLEYFSDLYAQVQQAKKPLTTDDPDYAAFYRSYYAYIDRMQKKTKADLAKVTQK